MAPRLFPTPGSGPPVEPLIAGTRLDVPTATTVTLDRIDALGVTTADGEELFERLLIAVVAVIAWFVFEAVAQATFFEWLGDRIDSLTD